MNLIVPINTPYEMLLAGVLTKIGLSKTAIFIILLFI
jgi:hypothetical protein